MRCSKFIDGITELACGRDDQGASAHVEECSDCASILDELRRVAAGFGLGLTHAPHEVVARAAQILLPKTVPTLTMVRTSLSAAGARRQAAESFQCVFEGKGVQVRSMYSKMGSKWQVMTTVQPPIGEIETGGKRLRPVDGRFEFEAKSLEATGFKIFLGGDPMLVPPGSSSIDDDST